MKSDTPRTDAETWKPFDTEAGCDMDCEVVDAEFARRLEREVNTGNEMYEKLLIRYTELGRELYDALDRIEGDRT